MNPGDWDSGKAGPFGADAPKQPVSMGSSNDNEPAVQQPNNPAHIAQTVKQSPGVVAAPQQTQPKPQMQPQSQPQTTQPETQAGQFTTDMSHTYSSPTTAHDQYPEKPKGKKMILLAIIVLFILLTFSGTSAFAYAVAYEKIKLDNAKLQLAVGDFVMSLPFAPKTPKFLVVKALMSQEKVKSNSFDLSLAIKSSQTENLFNTGEMNFQIKGTTEYTSQNKFNTMLNAAWGKDLNFDIVSYSDTLYFKVNTIPETALYLVGIDASSLKPFMNQWVSYDASKLETEAGKLLEEQEIKQEPIARDELLNQFNDFFDEEVTKHISVKTSSKNNHPVYQLTLNGSEELLGYIQHKIEESRSNTKEVQIPTFKSSEPELKDVIKNLKADLYIDEEYYYIRSISLYFDLIPPPQLSDLGGSSVLGSDTNALSFLESKISFAIVANFDNFGEPANISPPIDSITTEELAQKIFEIFPNPYLLNPEIETPEQVTPIVPVPTVPAITSPALGSFVSNGKQSVADGTTIEMTSVRKIGNTISATLVFNNPTNSVKTVYPLKVAMHDSTYGHPPEPAYSPYDLPAGSSKTFKTTYAPEDSASSVYWVYTDGSGAHYELGSMDL